MIKPGDLVMVVKPKLCCGRTSEAVGSIFRVTGLTGTASRTCSWCGTKGSGSPSRVKALGGKYEFYVERLKPIPPLSELDEVKRDEEITA